MSRDGFRLSLLYFLDEYLNLFTHNRACKILRHFDWGLILKEKEKEKQYALYENKSYKSQVLCTTSFNFTL